MEQTKDYAAKVEVCAFCHKDIPLSYDHALVKDGDQNFCNSICYMENRMNKPEKRTPILDWIRLCGIAIIILFTFIVLSVKAQEVEPGATVRFEGAPICITEAAAYASVMAFQLGGVEAIDEYFTSTNECGLARGQAGVISVTADIVSPGSPYIIWVVQADAGQGRIIYIFRMKEAPSI